MIHDQGEAIDSIENNIERVEVQAREADRNIQVAHKNQVGCVFLRCELLQTFMIKKIKKFFV